MSRMQSYCLDVDDLQNSQYFMKGAIKVFPDIHIHPGTTTLLAGYNGTGKSTLALQVGHELASVGIQTFVLSPEMPPMATAQILSRQAAAPGCPTVAHWQRAAKHVGDNFLISTIEGRLGPQECIRDFDTAYAAGCRLVILDSLTCVRCGPDLHNQADFADMLRAWARAHPDCYLLVVAHMRKPAGQFYSRVSRYDIRGAGEVSDLAGHVWLLERRDPFEAHDAQHYGEFNAALKVDKNRATGKLIRKMLNFSPIQRLFHATKQIPDYLPLKHPDAENVTQLY